MVREHPPKHLTESDMVHIRAFFKQRAEERNAFLASADLVAIRIDMARPAPDGVFEILFMPKEQALSYKPMRGDRTSILSFAEGVELALRPDCSGGGPILKVAARMSHLNKDVQALNLF